MDVLWMVIGINAVVWILIFAGFRHQRAQVERSLREEMSVTGEHIVLGPQNGYYAKVKGVVSVRSMGVMALTNKRLMFRVMFGKGFDVPVEDIADISGSTWFQGMYRNGNEFMILKLRDGSEIGFQTKNVQAWSEQVSSLMAS